jgi:hypothetical protein
MSVRPSLICAIRDLSKRFFTFFRNFRLEFSQKNGGRGINRCFTRLWIGDVEVDKGPRPAVAAPTALPESKLVIARSIALRCYSLLV